MADVMTGVPSIVMGLFIYTLWVLRFKAQSGFAGALALACLMLPIVIRSTEEMLRLVPDELRQASDALGARSGGRPSRSCCRRRSPGIISGCAARRRPGRRRDGAAAVHDRRRPRPVNTERLLGHEHRAVGADLPEHPDAIRRRPASGRGAPRSRWSRSCSSSRIAARSSSSRFDADAREPDRTVRRSDDEPGHERGRRLADREQRASPTPSTCATTPPGRTRDRAGATVRLVADGRPTSRRPPPRRCFELRRRRRLLRLVPGRPRRQPADRAGNQITAFIGPSGCGKTTFLRCFNRMNDLIPGRPGRGQGRATTASTSTTPDVDPIEVRRRIGMVFQKPNPFPKSIYDNVAFGPRINGHQGQHGRPRRAGAAPARRCGTR